MEQLTQCFWNKWRTHSEANSVTHNVPSLREKREPRASLFTRLCFCLLKGIRLHHSLPQSWLWDLWSLVRTEKEKHKRTFFWLSWFFFKPFLFLNNHTLCFSPSLAPPLPLWHGSVGPASEYSSRYPGGHCDSCLRCMSSEHPWSLPRGEGWQMSLSRKNQGFTLGRRCPESTWARLASPQDVVSYCLLWFHLLWAS